MCCSPYGGAHRQYGGRFTLVPAVNLIDILCLWASPGILCQKCVTFDRKKTLEILQSTGSRLYWLAYLSDFTQLFLSDSFRITQLHIP
jgi:hypothetical protein